jgi:hypothetical protein
MEVGKMKHTPGPWTVNSSREYNSGLPYIIWGPKGPGYGAVAYAFLVGLQIPDSQLAEVTANARLIAAAPDLRAACVSALEFAERGLSEGCAAILKQAIEKLQPQE